jgi:hypothetical protein
MKMKKILVASVITIPLCLLQIFQVAHGDIYKWVDEKGTVHFTEDPSRLPEKYWNKMKSRQNEEGKVKPEEKGKAKEEYERGQRNRLGKDSDMRQSEESIYLSVQKVPWELLFPKRGWQLQQERQRQDGLACYYMFSNTNTQLNASFSIEPAEKCKTSRDCRRLFWSNPGPSYENPQSIEQFEENGFAIVKFIIPSLRGVQVNQLNYSGHMVRDGYWIDMHLSKAGSQKGDEVLLSGFVKSVSFQQRAAVQKSAASTKTGKNERRYPIPDHGFLQMKVPSGWRDELQQLSTGMPPTIVLSPPTGNDFQILITPIWGAKKEALKEEAVRGTVQRSADEAKSQSVEKVIKVVELQGASGRGYYFFATDKAPKPGEWKFITQGTLVVGDLVVTFTILTNDSQEEVIKEALRMLREARHLK